MQRVACCHQEGGPSIVYCKKADFMSMSRDYKCTLLATKTIVVKGEKGTTLPPDMSAQPEDYLNRVADGHSTCSQALSRLKQHPLASHRVNGEEFNGNCGGELERELTYRADSTLRPIRHDGHSERVQRPGLFDPVDNDLGEGMLFSSDLNTIQETEAGVFDCLDLVNIQGILPLDLE
jgi:hypothetical protein